MACCAVSPVTSLAEVWIEILCCLQQIIQRSSLPLRKCGLKYTVWSQPVKVGMVTSLAEVWIEIPKWSFYKNFSTRHFPCGSVD